MQLDLKNIKLKNLGTVNKNLVTINRENRSPIYLYFSYETLVGVEANGQTLCTLNYWGPTTGKLLNEIEPDKNKRLTSGVFDAEVAKLFKSLE